MFHQNNLFTALKTGDIDRVQELINLGVDVSNIKWYGGYTPLHVAIEHGHFKVAQLLLCQENIDINSLNHKDKSALYLACAQWQKHPKESIEREYFGILILSLLHHHKSPANLIGFNTAAFTILFQVLKNQTRRELISVDFSDRSMGNNEMEALATAITHNNFISELKLARNNFTDDALRPLGSAIEDYKNSIRSIDLSFNNIGDDWFWFSGIQSFIIRALYNNLQLKHLNISNCVLDKADVRELLEFIKRTRKSHHRVKHIEFTVSEKVFASLDKEDQELVRTTQNLAKYLNIIKQMQDRLFAYTYLTAEEGELFQGCLNFLERCRSMFTGESDDLIPYFDSIAAALLEFSKLAIGKNCTHFNSYLDDAFQILESKRTTILNQLAYENKSVKTPVDIFYGVFENNMNALHTASEGVHSKYFKNQIKTPVEKYIHIAKDLIAQFVHVGKLVETAGEILHIAAVEGSELLAITGEGICHLTHDPFIEHGAAYFKDTLIKQLYGLTENEKCDNLMGCFINKGSASSKIHSIAHAIMHHYRASIEKLPQDEAKKTASILARYAYLHIAQLFMSGVLLKSERRLTADILIEEVILWLSYMPLQENGLRVNIMSPKEKEIAQEFFMQAPILFCDNAICTASIYEINHYSSQDAKKPGRMATQTETNLVNNLINQPLSELSGRNKLLAVTDGTIIKHQLFFNTSELIELKKKKRVETMLTEHQSKRKTLNSHGGILNSHDEVLSSHTKILTKLSKRVETLEIDNRKKDEIIEAKNNEIIELKNNQIKMQKKIEKLDDKIIQVNQKERRLSL
jgi:hypothetical protein